MTLTPSHTKTTNHLIDFLAVFKLYPTLLLYSFPRCSTNDIIVFAFVLQDKLPQLTDHDKNEKGKNKYDMTGREIQGYGRSFNNTTLLVPTKLTVSKQIEKFIEWLAHKKNPQNYY